MNYVEHLNLFGVEAKEIPCIKVAGAPTSNTVGAVGLLYMNTDNGDIYKCTSVTEDEYVWDPVDGNTLKTTAQSLTEEQKAQARENIGAVKLSSVWETCQIDKNENALLYDIDETTTVTDGLCARVYVSGHRMAKVSAYQWNPGFFSAIAFLTSDGSLISNYRPAEGTVITEFEIAIPDDATTMLVNGRIGYPLNVKLLVDIDIGYLVDTKADRIVDWVKQDVEVRNGYYASRSGGEDAYGKAEYITVDVTGCSKARITGFKWPVTSLYLFFDEDGMLVGQSDDTNDDDSYELEIDIPSNAKIIKVNGANQSGMRAKATISLYTVVGLDTLYEEICPRGKKLITLGDSITALGTGDTGWVKYFIEKTGCKLVANVAVNGAVLHDKVADTVYDGNPIWTTTDGDNMNNVLGNQVQKIINNAYEAPDIIMIAIGTNGGISITNEQIAAAYYDENDNLVPLENVDRTTSAGAYRWCLEKLHETYPNAIIFWCTPIMGYQTTRSAENAMRYAESLRIATEYTGQIMIDTIRCGINGVNEFNNENGQYLVDGLHPNVNGARKIGYYNASKVKPFLGNNFSLM